MPLTGVLLLTKEVLMSVERHLSHTVVLRVLLTVLMMVQSIFVTRLLGPEARGLFAKLQAAQSFFILFLGLGVTSAITYYVSNRKIELNKVMGVAFCTWFFGVVVLGGIQWATFHFPKADLIFPIGYASSFYEAYFILSFFFNSLQLVFNSALSGRKRFDMSNTMEIISAGLRVLIFGSFFIGRARGWELTVHQIFVADFCLSLLRVALFLNCYRREVGFSFRLSLTDAFKPMLGFSALIYISYVINFLYLRADYWIIEREIGLKALGVYSVAAGLGNFLTFIPMTLNMVMLPHLSAVTSSDAMAKLGMFSRLNAGALTLVTAVLVLFSRSIILVCYGAAFEEAIIPLRIVAISFFLLSIKHLFAYYNLSQARAQHNIYAECMGLVVGISGDFLLIPHHGILGASVASVTANFVSLTYIFVGIMRSGKGNVFDLFVPKLHELKTLMDSFVRSPVKEFA